MVFIPDRIPADPLDSSDAFVRDVPFDAKQAKISTRRHRWLWFFPLATQTGVGAYTQGLNAGATHRIQFDHRPDYVQISISGQTAVTGRCMVFMGEPGGWGIGPLGPGGKVTIPAPEGGIVSIVNVGSTPTFGGVTAIAGYADPGIDISLGS